MQGYAAMKGPGSRRRKMQFSEKKAAQVAAFFLYRAEGQLEILKIHRAVLSCTRARRQALSTSLATKPREEDGNKIS
jgi:hypothetical protein